LNPGDQPARLLEIISPAGFEHYFTALADILSGPGTPGTGQLAALANRYGLKVDLASIPQLAAAYGLGVALPERAQPTTNLKPRRTRARSPPLLALPAAWPMLRR
jgi:hypothetical protein